MTSEYTPYNPRNRVFTRTDIHTILRKHKCGHEVRKTAPFQTAMVHSSYVRRDEYRSQTGEAIELAPCPVGVMGLCDETYERLEHLGDSVLGSCVATYLFIRFPTSQEGFLTNLRKEIVCNATLGILAQKIGLSRFYVISRYNDENMNGRENIGKLGDILEAFIGALWVDSSMNFQCVYSFVCTLIETYIDIPRLLLHETNFKDRLQKHCQMKLRYTPTYVLISSSTNSYTSAVVNKQNVHIGTGTAPTKKQSEQNAAKDALETFGIPI